MTTTIKDQIIAAVVSRLAIVRTANGYNFDGGANVFRAVRKYDSKKTEAIIIWPGMDEIDRQYGGGVLEFTLTAEAESDFDQDENPSEVGEALTGDLIEALTGILYAYPFTNGGTSTPKGGDLVTGNSSDATAIIESVTVSTGSFPGGDAEGTFYFRRVDGIFESETLTIDDDSDAATIDGSFTGQDGRTLATGDLAESIDYIGGGIESYPDTGDAIIGIKGDFRIRYKTKRGDPYHQ